MWVLRGASRNLKAGVRVGRMDLLSGIGNVGYLNYRLKNYRNGVVWPSPLLSYVSRTLMLISPT